MSIDSMPAAEDDKPASGTLAWIFNWRGILADLPLFFALFWTHGETHRRLLAWGLGLLLLFLGFALRVWAQSHIHHRWEIPLPLAGSGPYSMVRNPLYIGNALLIVGATVCSRLLWLAPLVLAWCALIYFLVVRFEERNLIRWHGEPYLRYLSEVPRWLPRLLRQPDLLNRHSGRAVVAELHCLLIVVPFALKDFLISTPVGQALLERVAIFLH